VEILSSDKNSLCSSANTQALFSLKKTLYDNPGNMFFSTSFPLEIFERYCNKKEVLLNIAFASYNMSVGVAFKELY